MGHFPAALGHTRSARGPRVTRKVSSDALRGLLDGGGELALLDVREQGVHYRGHPFFACSLPLSRLEVMVEDLVPRRSAPIVLLDGGSEGLAERAEEKLTQLGYTDLAILEGGCALWKASGGELFSGVNVPSKAFGEFVEHRYDTPRMPPEELKRLQDGGAKLLIVDSRPYDEYHRMNIWRHRRAGCGAGVPRAGTRPRSGHAGGGELRGAHTQHHRLPVAAQRGHT